MADKSAKKKMNLMQLTFIVAVSMMGSGIIMLPANMAQVGAISLLSWLVTAVFGGMIAMMLAFIIWAFISPRFISMVAKKGGAA